MSFAALETYLLPFKNIFAEEGVNELMINKPGEAWVEKKGDQRLELIPEVDIDLQLTQEQYASEVKATLENAYELINNNRDCKMDKNKFRY